MKKLFVILPLLFMVSCVTTIPTQSNLSDQVLLMASNKNIKADFHLHSDILNGPIKRVYVQRDGRETVSQEAANYNSETAFRNMFSNYFSSKFNAFSRDEMRVEIHLRDLYLKETSATSVGAQILTGNAKSTLEAIAQVYVEIEYNGEIFRNEFEVNASDYRETQSTQYGTFSNTNPTQQMSLILQSAMNRAVIQFDGFVNSVLNAD
jgi:hypothetical protein